MKVIIAGTRNLKISKQQILISLDNFILNPTEIVSGNSGNVDIAGEIFALELGLKVTRFKANWELGKKAGPIRNKEMALYADVLLLIWDGKSKGSANMKKEMLSLNKPVYEVVLLSS